MVQSPIQALQAAVGEEPEPKQSARETCETDVERESDPEKSAMGESADVGEEQPKSPHAIFEEPLPLPRKGNEKEGRIEGEYVEWDIFDSLNSDPGLRLSGDPAKQDAKLRRCELLFVIAFMMLGPDVEMPII